MIDHDHGQLAAQLAVGREILSPRSRAGAELPGSPDGSRACQRQTGMLAASHYVLRCEAAQKCTRIFDHTGCGSDGGANSDHFGGVGESEVALRVRSGRPGFGIAQSHRE